METFPVRTKSRAPASRMREPCGNRPLGRGDSTRNIPESRFRSGPGRIAIASIPSKRPALFAERGEDVGRKAGDVEAAAVVETAADDEDAPRRDDHQVLPAIALRGVGPFREALRVRCLLSP